ncbi:MAG TPA: MAPEG family protein [Aliidongia sp.]|uniref:MAPEG family protein n=1 Tax=Aliidongia sp. TaxID=1914230 RepID=UPI002DDCA42B|nr:MAPEG family protein [Aliidongia sp.]HEV2676459.1 MAPEG family protein [Aliidongia sp.]
MPLTITPLYAALAAVILLVLMFRVIRLRRSLSVGLGTGGHSALERAVRGHGNFTEYTPLGLILVASAELSGAAGHWVHAIGILLIVGRVLHPWGLAQSSGASIGRVSGILLTAAALLLGTGVNLFQFFGR